MTEEFHGRVAKKTFVVWHDQSVNPVESTYFQDVLKVFGSVADENVMYIAGTIGEVTEDAVH